MPLSPYGQDPYGSGADAHPSAPRNLAARPGMQGPQVILTWDVAPRPPLKLMVRRKQGEFPRDITDGVLVLLDEATAETRTQVVDLGDDLLDDGAAPGDGAWWYYQVFITPSPLPLAEQHGGLGVQTRLDIPWFNTTTPIDVRDARRITVYLENLSSVEDATVVLQTAPSLDGPWVDLTSAFVAAATMETWETGASIFLLRAVVSGAAVRISFNVDIPLGWQTGSDLSAQVYVFKTGRHLAAALQHLPAFYLQDDRLQGLASLFERAGEDGEYFNLDENGSTYGPLVRYLMVYLAEFDRVDAYLRAVRAYTVDVDEMPPQQFTHVAEMLGYPLEVDGRNYEEVRAELLRIAGVWRKKGTAALVQATCAQVFGRQARVQEGAGRVFRVADPDLFPVNRGIFEDIGG